MNRAIATLFAFGGLVALTGCPNWTGAHKSTAEDEAREYAQELNLELEAVSCVKQDTDGDGYVSCTLKLKDGQTLPRECAGAYNLNSGCREQKLKMPGAKE